MRNMDRSNIHTQYIEMTRDICGDKPCIAGHRIRVQDIDVWYERGGMGADVIASQYQLTLRDVFAALVVENRKRVVETGCADGERGHKELHQI